ncbi:MAG: 1,4-alpha-glucan branching protein GlgB [Eubacteriales bacterium]|nr:1,4-alpha-glucan branching protein GlgB [Eubacteriales bacterium]
MNEKLYHMINWADVEEIEYVDSRFPKRILGPHAEGDGTLIQAFVPHAEEMELVIEKKSPIPMERMDEEGFYAIWLPQKIRDYQFNVCFDNGVKMRMEDPYNPKYGSIFKESDYKKFSEGIAYDLYKKLGAHLMQRDGVCGVNFAVFAPEAARVSVVGDFNLWDGRRHQMQRDDLSGIFELFVPGLVAGDLYKFEIKPKHGEPILKADPYAFYSELRPANASIVWDTEAYKWGDEAWIAERKKRDFKTSPMSIYEVHLGSWKQRACAIDEDGSEVNGSRFYSYRELAPELAAYVKKMGYTHIELMPVMEHPFDGSWGYQVTGYFAPTSRHGNPDDFKYFMDYMHAEGIGVILDWVPAHFPKDAFGLAQFDGSHVYEHRDPRKGEHPHWGTLIFNYGKPQVVNFLISNAMYWAEVYHADGIRMDAVASMLYLDYGRNDGEWVANIYGGHENLEAIEFLKHLNSIMHKRNPGVLMIAEESTAWPMITGDPAEGGLGFDLKWNMGFMNDFLKFMQTDPFFRKDNYGALTFSMIYNYSEHFVLVFSHDEVVHLKGSMFSKMPSADFEEKARNLRTAYGFFFGHPDKKLLFMGQDFAQNDEWQECMSLEWNLLQYPLHANMQNYVKSLNELYRSHPALWQEDYDPAGFEWINCSYQKESMVMFLRKTKKPEETLLFVCNFDNLPHRKFRVGVPFAGSYKEILNSEDKAFGGSGAGNPRAIRAKAVHWDEQKQSIEINIPPMSTLVFSCTPEKETDAANKKSVKTGSGVKSAKASAQKAMKNAAKLAGDQKGRKGTKAGGAKGAAKDAAKAGGKTNTKSMSGMRKVKIT